MKTDREIVEYLDESVVFVEVLPDGNWIDDSGRVKGKIRYSSCPNPTLTLEYMLGKLREKGITIKFYPITNIEHSKYGQVICEIEKKENYRYLLEEGTEAKTEIQALRGVIEKLMEEERCIQH